MKSPEFRSKQMTVLGKIRAISLTLLVATLAPLSAATAQTQSPAYMRLAAGDTLDNRPVYLGIDKSVVIDLPRPAGDVLVSNPQIADAVLRTSSRLYLIGVKLGQASVFLFDNSGVQIASFDVYVEADLGSLNQLLAEAIPNGYVRAEAIQGSIVLRGTVPSTSDVSRAVMIANSMIAAQPLSTSNTASSGTAAQASTSSSTSTYSPDAGPGIVNLLTISNEEQVAVKVTVAEMQRSVAKQLGINISGSYTEGDFKISSPLGLSPLGAGVGTNFAPGQAGISFTSGGLDLQATIRALDETSMIRTLAEPTLTAVSGETAEFLVGGEVPFVTGIDTSSGITSVDFKKFGVQLAFTPVVLGPGRISLRVRTEVSDVAGFSSGGQPILSVRRAETTVEQPSGGSFVIAGLLQQNTQRAVGGFPGLRSVPILGALFSSKNFLNSETELVMIVTPYLVKPTSPQALARPDDNLMQSNDGAYYFLNRLTKVYGSRATVPGGEDSHVGFNFD
jgi:pilus assembly protein CpaC